MGKSSLVDVCLTVMKQLKAESTFSSHSDQYFSYGKPFCSSFKFQVQPDPWEDELQGAITQSKKPTLCGVQTIVGYAYPFCTIKRNEKIFKNSRKSPQPTVGW